MSNPGRQPSLPTYLPKSPKEKGSSKPQASERTVPTWSVVNKPACGKGLHRGKKKREREREKRNKPLQHVHMQHAHAQHFSTLPLLYSLRLSLGLLNSQEDSRSIHLDNGYILLNPPEEARPRARPRPDRIQ